MYFLDIDCANVHIMPECTERESESNKNYGVGILTK